MEADKKADDVPEGTTSKKKGGTDKEKEGGAEKEGVEGKGKKELAGDEVEVDNSGGQNSKEVQGESAAPVAPDGASQQVDAAPAAEADPVDSTPASSGNTPAVANVVATPSEHADAVHGASAVPRQLKLSGRIMHKKPTLS